MTIVLFRSDDIVLFVSNPRIMCMMMFNLLIFQVGDCRNCRVGLLHQIYEHYDMMFSLMMHYGYKLIA